MSRWRLAARFLPPNDHLLLVAFHRQDPQDWFVYDGLLPGEPMVWFAQFNGNGPGNFPFGWPVEPD